MFSTTLLPFTSFHTICTLSFNPAMLGASPTSYKWASKYQVHFSLKDYLLIFYIINLCEYLKNKWLHNVKDWGTKKVCS
jgi:hypothetical protein